MRVIRLAVFVAALAVTPCFAGGVVSGGAGGGGGSGDVTAAANIADDAIIRGDGGAKGVQTSGWQINDSDVLSSPAGGPGTFDLTDGACSTGAAGKGRICQEATPVNGSSLMYFDSGGAAKAVVLGDGTGITAGAIDAADIGAGAVGTSELATVAKTGTLVFIVGAENGAALADADDQPSIFPNLLGQGITIQEVVCQYDQGATAPIINLQRDDGSPANILSSNLTCTTGRPGAAGTIDTNEDNVADDEEIDFVMVTAGGNAKRVRVAIRYTLD